MIRVQNLTFSYESNYENIFENVNLDLDTSWKLGFIGRNGRGKTTFLHLLLGKYDYEGDIHSSVEFGYFPYEIPNKEMMVGEIFNEFCPLAQDWEFMKELSYLEVDDDVFWRKFSTLSQGEQTKVLIAILFLSGDKFLLIDEPTNHLDENARKIIGEYLKNKSGFILVSHDRDLLDECVDHILAINKSNIELQNGNFSSWFENFERQQKFENLKNKKLKKDIDNLQKSAVRTSEWSDRVEATKYGNGPVDRGFIGHKAAKMMKRSKSLERRKQNCIDEKKSLLKNFESSEDLKIFPLKYYSDKLVSLSNIVTIYDEKEICKPISFELKQGERVFINGINGSGKSSLIKLLLGYDIKYKGEITFGSKLIISYVSQDTSFLNGTVDNFIKEYGINEKLFRSILSKMNFGYNQTQKMIEDFSDGQKKKLLIAKSLCEEAHLYIWDEPLNYIDIYSRIQIKDLINKFSPTMIVIEHDSKFRDEVATKVIKIEKAF